MCKREKLQREMVTKMGITEVEGTEMRFSLFLSQPQVLFYFPGIMIWLNCRGHLKLANSKIKYNFYYNYNFIIFCVVIYVWVNKNLIK